MSTDKVTSHRRAKSQNHRCLSRVSGWLVVLSLATSAGAEIHFSLDYAGFRSAHCDSTTVEFYHSIPYDQLHYQAFGDTIEAWYQVILKLTNLTTGDSVVRRIFEGAVIPSFREAQERQISILKLFSENLRPGNYLLRMEVSDSFGCGAVSESITVRDLSAKPSVSDLIIGEALIEQESGITSVRPLPSRQFGIAGRREMYVYLTGYDFAGDSAPYEVLAEIRDQSGKVIKTLPPSRRLRRGSTVRELFGLTTQGLKTGDYLVRVTLRDLLGGAELSAEKSFSVSTAGGASINRQKKLTPEEEKEYRDIHYLATERQLREYKQLNDAGKEEWLRRFWQERDFPSYYARLKLADARYAWGGSRGRDTDKGRIFLRYGEPDETEVHTMIENALPHEHWHYYKAGFHFIFVDVRSDGRMKLVWSNCPDESNAQNWENLVDPQEKDGLPRR